MHVVEGFERIEVGNKKYFEVHFTFKGWVFCVLLEIGNFVACDNCGATGVDEAEAEIVAVELVAEVAVTILKGKSDIEAVDVGADLSGRYVEKLNLGFGGIYAGFAARKQRKGDNDTKKDRSFLHGSRKLNGIDEVNLVLFFEVLPLTR